METLPYLIMLFIGLITGSFVTYSLLQRSMREANITIGDLADENHHLQQQVDRLIVPVDTYFDDTYGHDGGPEGGAA